MNRSENWENERYIFEKLKQTQIFKYWKKTQFDCQVGKCAWCEKPMQYRYAETDHVKPLYYGGKSEASNLVLCHHNCNKNKSTASGYKRPEWIKRNSYDEAVTRKYNSLVTELFPEDKKDDSEQEYSIEPNLTVGRNKDEQVYHYRKVEMTNAPRSASNSKPVYSYKKKCGAKNELLYYLKYLALAALAFGAAFLIPKIMSSVRQSSSTPSGSGSSGSQISEKPVEKTEDDNRKTYAQTILAGYTNYYKNYANESTSYKWGLPADAFNCPEGNGCYMFRSFSGASIPKDYTYSINSLENGVVFKQTGIIPHASTSNIALYKRARCGSAGTVVGGSADENAAVVVQLSDGTYYCVQN